MLVLEDRTTLNPSTIDVMVDSPSKKTKACTIQVALLWEFVSSEGGYLWSNWKNIAWSLFR